MFDISWSELLILGIVTLVFVGPKELPVLMRTLGKYAGMARRHANEFRAQFEAAMREAELDTMRKEVDQMQTSINSEIMSAKTTLNTAAAATKLDEPPPSASISPGASAAPSVPPPAPEPVPGSGPQPETADALPMPPMPAPPRMEP
jgi:sec-independent protein translocase protein TatB